MAIYHIYHIFERGGSWRFITYITITGRGGSGSFITVYHIGGGSLGGPKNYDVIFAQPLKGTNKAQEIVF